MNRINSPELGLDHGRSCRTLSRADLLGTVAQLIQKVDSVLDVGCGLRPQHFFEAKTTICCEPHAEYVDILKSWFADVPGVVVVQATWDGLIPLLPDDAVDSVFLLDVIEHLDKDEGRRLLTECERVARRQVIVFTPLGFVPQEYEHDDDPDAWGLQGAKWQRHQSGWLPEDFDDTYQCLVCSDYHAEDNRGRPREVAEGAFWAIKTKADKDRPGDAKSSFVQAKSASTKVAVATQEFFFSPAIPMELCEELLQAASQGSCVLLSNLNLTPYTLLRSRGRLPSQPRPSFDKIESVDVFALRATSHSSLPGWLRYLCGLRSRARAVRLALQTAECTAVLGISGGLECIPATYSAAKKLRIPFFAYVGTTDLLEFRVTPGRFFARHAHSIALRGAKRVLVSDPALVEPLWDQYRVRAKHLSLPFDGPQTNGHAPAMNLLGRLVEAIGAR